MRLRSIVARAASVRISSDFEARAIAAQLSRHNEERRAIEAAVQEAAEAQIASQHNRAVLVLAGVRRLGLAELAIAGL